MQSTSTPPYVSGVDVSIKSISIAGNTRTKQVFFERELSDVNSAQTINQLHSRLETSVERMKSYGIFDAVHANIDIVSADVLGNKYEALLEVHVKEKNIPQLKIETYVKSGKQGSGEYGVEIQGLVRNPLGFGEVLSVSAIPTGSGSREHYICMRAPFPAPFLNDVTLTAKSLADNMSVFTGYHRKETGLTIAANLHTRLLESVLGHSIASNPYIQHSIEGSFTYRDEIPISHPTIAALSTSPEAILQIMKATTKCALKYTLQHDSRAGGASSTSGSLLSASVEAALPPGIAQFVKTDLRVETHSLLGPPMHDQPGLAMSVAGAIGMLASLDSNSALSDRYYLGGPMSLRGFYMHGCGPRSRTVDGVSSPLGGRARTALLLSLHCPLPLKPLAQAGGRAFAFVNCGGIGQGFKSLSPFGYMRASVGTYARVLSALIH